MAAKLCYDVFKKYFIMVLGVLTAFVHIGQFTFMPMESIKFYAWHLMLGLTMVFLYKPSSKSGKAWGLALDWLLVACNVWIGVSVIANYDAYSLMMQNNRLTPYFTVLGAAAMLLALEAARRVIGLVLPIIALITVAYALWGGDLPGLLGHRGYTFQRVFVTTFSDQGIYGSPIGVSASTVYLFLLFAAFLSVSGADKIFQQIATALTGRKRGGPAKMAVVASCLFGSISGSAVANVVSTGSFTIPLMKRQGYQPRFAGAVEAVASTGGQIMPPIMGAAAFVLADIAATPYATVCLAALLPALMYYMTLFKMVDLESVKYGLLGLSEEEIPSVRGALKGSFKLLIPLAVLLVLLLVVRTTPMYAAIWSTLAIVICGFFGKKEPMALRSFLDGFVEATRSMPAVVSACACSGIVTGMFALTGLGLKFSSFVMTLGESSILLSLLLSMLICSILGMGLPTTAAYIICATALAPALVKLGIPVLASHLFLLYFASISSITPPVAVASYAAAGIAKENPLKVGFTAVKLGIAGFVLPFTFALNPDYLHFGFDFTTLFTWISAFVVCYAAAIAIMGWQESKVTIPERVLYCMVIVTAIQSNFLISLFGWVVFAALYIGRKSYLKKKSLAA